MRVARSSSPIVTLLPLKGSSAFVKCGSAKSWVRQSCLFLLLALTVQGVFGEGVSLHTPSNDMLGWKFRNGPEFPGAEGTLSKDYGTGEPCLKLEANFEGGGGYVEASRELQSFKVERNARIVLKVKSIEPTKITLRFVDETGQCFQKADFHLDSNDQWQEISIFPSEMEGMQHWNGANDGQWHGLATRFTIILPKTTSPHPILWIGDVNVVAAP